MNGHNFDDYEIGRPNYQTNDIRYLTSSNATRQTPPEPKGFLRIRAAVSIALALYSWTWLTGIFNTALWTSLAAATAAIRTARRSTDPDASDLSFTLANIARYTAGAWLIYTIPTGLYIMHAQGVGALLTYQFTTP